jgi:3-oxoadipate enol-lactonase
MGTTAGLRWRVDGAGPCVVLVHGWALTLDYFAAVAPLLAQQFRVLRFDRRGFGSSRGTPSLATDVEDLFALLDEIGEQRAVLVGMSQGARVVVAAALARASRVRGVVLDGPPALVDNTTPPAAGTAATSDDDRESELPLDELRAVLASLGTGALQDRLRHHALFQLVTTNPMRRALLDEMLRRYDGKDLTAANGTALRCELQTLRQPLLIINGEQDSASRCAAGVALTGAIAGSKRAVLPNAGHLAALDVPEKYVSEVARFIAPESAGRS